jgi:hypothetical protein
MEIVNLTVMDQEGNVQLKITGKHAPTLLTRENLVTLKVLHQFKILSLKRRSFVAQDCQVTLHLKT